MKGKDIRTEVDDNGFHLSSLRPRPLREGVDFYLEGAAMVFTALYHLRRGSCCESGCRHCPFRGGAAAAAAAGAPVENREGVVDAEKDASL
ncbi:MAG: DUF5522 domain-containing protein [Acidobacteria bacterium]|nr:DUF5522 domain-containing protein [Acidobacteriota bacterium]